MRQACTQCRNSKRKCSFSDGQIACDSCTKRNLYCTIEAEEFVVDAKRKFGKACLSCSRVKKACSACTTGHYPCAECLEHGIPCENRARKRRSSGNPDQKDSVHAQTKLTCLCLAMNTSFETLQIVDPKTLPGAFGLSFSSNSNWVLVYYPRDLDPKTLEFLQNGRVANCVVSDQRLPANFKEFVLEKKVGELRSEIMLDKPDSELRVVLSCLSGDPGRPRIKRLLEIGQYLCGYTTSFVLNSLIDVTGVCRLQFVQFTLINPRNRTAAVSIDNFIDHIGPFDDQDWFDDLTQNDVQTSDLAFALPDIEL